MIGSKIKTLRENKELSQKGLATILGISPSTVGMYEQDRRAPDTEMLLKLADYFKVSVDYLLGKTDNKTNNLDKSLNKKDEKDIEKALSATLEQLESAQDGLMFDGEILDDETRELLRASLENSMKMAKMIAKAKYTPNKFKKD